MNGLQSEAALDIDAQEKFKGEMEHWNQINEGVLEAMHDVLKVVDHAAYNDYVKKKTNEGPCKVQ